MKETDDDSLVDGTDAGAVPATSTNTRSAYDGIFEFHKAMRKIDEDRTGLTGWTVHGVKVRSTELRGVKQNRRTDEDVSEDLDTKN